MKKQKNKKLSLQERISVLVTFAFALIIVSLSIGFAYYTKNVLISGTATLNKVGRVEITRVEEYSRSNVRSAETPTFDGTNASFNITFKKQGNNTLFQIIYDVDLYNGYYKDYIFRGFDFNPVITTSSDSDGAVLNLSVDGVENGEVLHPGDTKSFKLILTLEVSNVNGTYGTQVDTEADLTEPEQDTGTLIGSVTPLTGDLTNDQMAQFTATVINTFKYEKQFRLLSSNTNLMIVDSSGNPIGDLTIPSNSTQEYTFYLKPNSEAIFLTETANTTILVNSSGIANSSAGDLTLSVDVFEGVDNDKVVVSNATLTMSNTVGTIEASWNRDDVGGTDVVDYVITLYKNNTAQTPIHTNSSVTSYTFTNQDDANYYFVVYGIDAVGNTGESSASSATTSAGYATKSPTLNAKWHFTVTNSLRNLTSNGATTTTLGETYIATLSASGWTYSRPSSLTSVTMGGRTLTSGTDYTYNSSSGRISIPNVNGDIVITASATSSGICLIEGTKVLLANGKYKNIEDVDYDDLLLVYNYETGKFTKEYPIWIEKEHRTSLYQETTFTDGSKLKTVGFHGVYERELNRFVTVDNKEEFHVGSSIAKINKNRTGFNTVKVKNITYKYEDVNYYHVVSTRYYNIIADDFLTTDGTVILSNLYGFTSDMKWNLNLREQSLKDPYTYDDLKDAIPYYMFVGLRAEEGKFLQNYGFSLDLFKMYLKNNQNNKNMLKDPIKKNNKNLWMVTTSEDIVTDSNKAKYLRYEGSTYILPRSISPNFVSWYNTSDGKTYHPGDKVTVVHGIHFEAIYN